MRSSKRAIALAVLLGLAFVPIAGHAEDGIAGDGWCYVTGQVQGLASVLTCTYRAPTTTQTVYVGTPFHWNLTVTRPVYGSDVYFDEVTQTWVTYYGYFDREIILVEGDGPSPGALIQVHPRAGETVSVHMFSGCVSVSPICGTMGYLGAGLEYGNSYDAGFVHADHPRLTDGDSHTAGTCSAEGTASFSPALTGTSGTSAVTDRGTLSNCVSDDMDAPSSGTRSSGNVVTDGGTVEQPWTWAEPAETLTGNCTTATVAGISILRWSDGTVTVVNASTTSNTWGIQTAGQVIPSVSLPAVDRKVGQPATLTVATNRFVGQSVSGVQVASVNPADPLECTTTGLTSTTMTGTHTFHA